MKPINACNHGHTVVFSRTMVIDKCQDCGGFLVWCVNPAHESERHYHLAETVGEATRLTSAPFDRSRGANRYGVKRPIPALPGGDIEPDYKSLVVTQYGPMPLGRALEIWPQLQAGDFEPVRADNG